MSLKIVFSFFAAGIVAILGAGSVLLGFFSAATSGVNQQASATAGGFAQEFLLFAVILGLLTIYLKLKK